MSKTTYIAHEKIAARRVLTDPAANRVDRENARLVLSDEPRLVPGSFAWSVCDGIDRMRARRAAIAAGRRVA